MNHRRKHADEYAEQARQEAARAARLERENALREETKKLEALAEEERRQRRRERHDKRWREARDLYEERWKMLLATQLVEDEQTKLCFTDVPWPVFPTEVGSSDRKGKRSAAEYTVRLDDLTADSISRFLLSTPQTNASGSTLSDDAAKKARRDRLRETMLRFHPDKFEGRILPRVQEADRDAVREGVSKVAIALNQLMETK